MKNFKKIFILLLIIIPCLLLSSCTLTTSRGMSAYEIAVKNGFTGTEAEWLESLKGTNGTNLTLKDIYQECLAEGTISSTMTYNEFIAYYLQNADVEGKSAYEVAVENGFKGTEAEWLASLKGDKGDKGDAYDVDTLTVYNAAKALGYEGTYVEFLKEVLGYNQDLETALVNYNLFASVSLVTTFTEKTTTSSSVWSSGETSTTEKSYSGSGVIYEMDDNGNALIITNMHMTYSEDAVSSNKGPNSIKVFLYGKEYKDFAIEATLVGGSITFDVAVIQIKDSEILKNASDVHAVEFGNSNTITVGEAVYAIGNADGAGIAATRGIISKDSEYIQMNGLDNKPAKYREIRVDAAINGGNSGGGLFNSKGQLIGIVNAKLESSTIDNMGYVIPESIVSAVVNSLLRYCLNSTNERGSRVLLGVTVTTNSSSAYYDKDLMKAVIVEEVIVVETSDDSLARACGLQANDVLLEIIINGQATKITRQFILGDKVLTLKQGDSCELKIKRDGVEQIVSVFDSTTQLSLKTLE